MVNEDLIQTCYINNLTYIFIDNQNLFRLKRKSDRVKSYWHLKTPIARNSIV